MRHGGVAVPHCHRAVQGGRDRREQYSGIVRGVGAVWWGVGRRAGQALHCVSASLPCGRQRLPEPGGQGVRWRREGRPWCAHALALALGPTGAPDPLVVYGRLVRWRVWLHAHQWRREAPHNVHLAYKAVPRRRHTASAMPGIEVIQEKRKAPKVGAQRGSGGVRRGAGCAGFQPLRAARLAPDARAHAPARCRRVLSSTLCDGRGTTRERKFGASRGAGGLRAAWWSLVEAAAPRGEPPPAQARR